MRGLGAVSAVVLIGALACVSADRDRDDEADAGIV